MAAPGQAAQGLSGMERQGGSCGSNSGAGALGVARGKQITKENWQRPAKMPKP